MLYRYIEKHEAGYDYEFEEGILVNITHMHVDEYGDLDFCINGEVACATVEEFNAVWAPVLDNDSVKNLQKEWAERIKKDKRLLSEDTYEVANEAVQSMYGIYEVFYRMRFKYDMYATCKYIRNFVKEEKAIDPYVASILKDFAELWIAQHM